VRTSASREDLKEGGYLHSKDVAPHLQQKGDSAGKKKKREGWEGGWGKPLLNGGGGSTKFQLGAKG